MPYEFRGENLVYVEPPEVTGYTWSSIGGGADTAPEEKWVKNPDFDISSILDTKTDKYGREVSTLKENATEADRRAYNLSRNYDPSDWQVKTEMQTGANPDWVNNMNKGWWDVDPAIQEQWQAANRATSGNAVGMSGFKDWIVPLSILAAGAGTAIGTGALAGGAAAGEAGGALTTSEILGSNFAGSNFAIDPLATYTPGLSGAEIYSNPTTQQMIDFANARPDPIQALTELQSMTPTELSTALGSGAGSSFLSSASEALKTANQVRQGLGTASSIAKLVSPSTGGATGTTGGGANLNQLANLLRPQTQTNDFLGQYKMNQNPFSFTSQGQTAASPGMYDVSGSNLANALRKA
jgi:hypothetical protein